MRRTIVFNGLSARVEFTAPDVALDEAVAPQRLVTGEIEPKPVPVIAWDGRYRLDTTQPEDAILSDIERVQAHHEQKSARMNGFMALYGTELTIGGQAYTWTDCTIRKDEDARRVELYASVRAADGVRPKCMPLKRRYASIGQVPSDETIVGMVVAAIEAENAAAAAQEAKIARLNALFNG